MQGDFSFPSCLEPEFRPVEYLALGGQSHVHIAEESSTRKLVILKVYQHKPEGIRKRYDLIRSLQHPCILKPQRLVENEVFAMVFPLVRGGTLTRRLQKRALNFQEAGRVLAQLVTVLSYFAQMGMVHRDIKPDNLLMSEQDSILMTDFDFAHFRSSWFRDRFLSSEYKTQGTAWYMAPEHLKGAIPHVSMDHYAVATMYYQLLTGNFPFGKDLAARNRTDSYVSASSLTKPQNQALKQALHPDPRSRLPVRALYEKLYLW